MLARDRWRRNSRAEQLSATPLLPYRARVSFIPGSKKQQNSRWPIKQLIVAAFALNAPVSLSLSLTPSESRPHLL